MTTDDERALVALQRDGHVLVITMQRHDKRNAVDRALAEALSAALDELDDDDSLWCGVLTGGPDFFSAGSDLASKGDNRTERGGEYGIIRRRRRTPLIAAVEGFALGGGLEIVLACDLVVAARTATFGLPEVRVGVLPTCGALFRGPRALPLNLARQLILTGAPIDAQRAFDVGFVNELTEPGAALERAVAMAHQISANAPLSVRACLAAIDEELDALATEGWPRTQRALDSILGSDDTAEGVRAFFERRPPRWQAR